MLHARSPGSPSAASQTVCRADVWHEASPGRLIVVSLPREPFLRTQIGRLAVSVALSDDGLTLGRPGAKGQKEDREAVKFNQRLFVLESIGAHSLLFTNEEPQAQKRESMCRGHIPYDQLNLVQKPSPLFPD